VPQPTSNIFSDIRRNIKVSRVRKVSNSFFTYLRSLRKDSTAGGKVEVATTLATNTVAIAGTGTAAFTLAVGATAAEIAAGAAFIAAISGPWAGITLGLIGLALLAKSTYSSRESAHEELFKYCWNIIDTTPPDIKIQTEDDLKKAASAAMKLLEEGGKQLSDQARKFQEASDKFTLFHSAITPKFGDAHRAFVAMGSANATVIRGSNDPAFKGEVKTRAEAVAVERTREFKAIKTSISDAFGAAIVENGAIFEYVRRCQHYGEYIQAPHIISLSYRWILSGDSAFSVPLSFSNNDFFAGLDKVHDLRVKLAALCVAYNQVAGLAE
jgi:hypothetical protein